MLDIIDTANESTMQRNEWRVWLMDPRGSEVEVLAEFTFDGAVTFCAEPDPVYNEDERAAIVTAVQQEIGRQMDTAIDLHTRQGEA